MTCLFHSKMNPILLISNIDLIVWVFLRVWVLSSLTSTSHYYHVPNRMIDTLTNNMIWYTYLVKRWLKFLYESVGLLQLINCSCFQTIPSVISIYWWTINSSDSVLTSLWIMIISLDPLEHLWKSCTHNNQLKIDPFFSYW